MKCDICEEEIEKGEETTEVGGLTVHLDCVEDDLDEEDFEDDEEDDE